MKRKRNTALAASNSGSPTKNTKTSTNKTYKHYAIVGAGIAGIACARTLAQAGHRVTVFEQNAHVGGRMCTTETSFGGFDTGAQYFTVRDARFALALETAQGLFKPWSANTVRVLDAQGRVASASLPSKEAHYVATPSMDTLVRHWAQPLLNKQENVPSNAAAGMSASTVELSTQVTQIERDALNQQRWQLRTLGNDGTHHVYSGYDVVLLAIPSEIAHSLLQNLKQKTALATAISNVKIAPCWTLSVAFPQAVQPNMAHIGPQWNAARSSHHRISWLARESSKPGRSSMERWTVQASPAWSAEHLEDDAPRVQAKLLKAFTEVSGIYAQPAYAEVYRWRYAQTTQALGKSHLWDAKLGIGVCGDWCLGHRVEDAFVSGLELALTVA